MAGTISGNCAILEISDKRYNILFYKTPKGASFRNNQSALKNKDFVEASIFELLKCDSIIEEEKPPKVIEPLSVSMNSSSKKHLILRFKICKYPFLQRQNKVQTLEVL